jgi:hypothetical protein
MQRVQQSLGKWTQRIRRLAASAANEGAGVPSSTYNICGIARRARASGRSRTQVEATTRYPRPQKTLFGHCIELRGPLSTLSAS